MFVCDYKTDGTPEPQTTRMSESFIDSVPQLATYNKILKLVYGVKKVYCVTFNKHGEWIYLDSLLTDVENFMVTQGISHEINWKDYIY